jgi:hypothetical protein
MSQCSPREEYVADLVKQVVLDLKVESADEPSQQAVVAGEINGCLNLVHRPLRLQPGAPIG